MSSEDDQEFVSPDDALEVIDLPENDANGMRMF